MKIILVLLLFVVNIYANSQWYIGMGTLSGDSKTTYSDITNSEEEYGNKEEHDALMANIKLGYIFSTNTRFEMSISSIELDGDMFMDTNSSGTSTLSGMDFDWIYTPDGTNFGEFATFISIGLGFYTYDDTEGLFDAVDITDDGSDLSGAALNLGAGLLFYITDTFEIELSYKYKSIGWSLIRASGGEILNSETEITGGYIGFRYAY